MFSIFDPVSFMELSLNWLSSFVFLFLLCGSYWQISSNFQLSLSNILDGICAEFKAILGDKYVSGMHWLSLSFFLFIFLNNFMGLFPYVFTSSSHLTFTIGLALPMWLGYYLYAWAKTPQGMLAHLVPLGSPLALAPFMVVVELLSSMIRPITLSVRLTANMVAGHLLLVLLSGPASGGPLVLVLVILMGLIMLSMLECAVATIQAYVFSTLSILYYEEVSSPNFT